VAASLAKTVADRPDRAAAILLAADLLRPSLEGGRAISMNDFRAAVVQAFGGTEAEGFWLWKDAFDACKAQLFFLREFAPTIVSRSGSTASALAMIMKVAKLMPTRMLAEALALADKNTQAVFIVEACSSRAAVQVPTASVRLDDGTIEPRVRLVRPIAETRFGLDPLAETHWQSVERDMFARLWQAEVGNVPEFPTSTFDSVTGFLQPIRRRLPMHVRPNGPESGRGAAGKRVAFVAALVMSRICDRVLSHRRSTAYAQHAVGAPREVS
jgi:hypothetical protein